MAIAFFSCFTIQTHVAAAHGKAVIFHVKFAQLKLLCPDENPASSFLKQVFAGNLSALKKPCLA